MSDFQTSAKGHLPGLDAIRGIAAYAVVVGHIETYRGRMGYTVYDIPLFRMLGQQAIVCFFVLSGFLITYLLFLEKNSRGTINIRKFYVRRILRIWPLYYFVALLGLFVVPTFLVFEPLAFQPDRDFVLTSFLYLTLFANVGLVYAGHVAVLGPLWSIGVEG